MSINAYKNPTLQIERKPAVISRMGISRSLLHVKINQGLFPRPINLGGRAVGWLEHETTAIIKAMAAGKSNTEVQVLVNYLADSRKELSQ